MSNDLKAFVLSLGGLLAVAGNQGVQISGTSGRMTV